MTARQLREELDLAAWELAEAEGHQRRAARLRRDAVARLARLSLAVRDAEALARRTPGNPISETTP